MKIRITGNTWGSAVWYSGRIGEEFEVMDFAQAKNSSILSPHHNSYNDCKEYVVYKNGSWGFVTKIDCELVEERKPMKIRITAPHPTYWYQGFVGQEFKLLAMSNKDYDFKESKYLSEPDNCYVVVTELADGQENPGLVCWEHGEIVEDEQEFLTISEFMDRVKPSNKYQREIKPGVFVDIYDVLKAFDVKDPCLQHLSKKALCAGIRGHKDRLEDLEDIQKSIQRAIEMHKEWSKE